MIDAGLLMRSTTDLIGKPMRSHHSVLKSANFSSCVYKCEFSQFIALSLLIATGSRYVATTDRAPEVSPRAPEGATITGVPM